MRALIRDHGLLLANLALFAVFLAGMALTGWHAYDLDQQAHGETAVGLLAYLATGDFVEATFENWESEFLQMGMYVVLTAKLVTRGSSESKPVEGDAPQDADPRDHAADPGAPWPVRRGGPWLAVYEHSLSIFFLACFAGSFALHAAGGAAAYSDDQVAHGEAAVSVWAYLATSRFWFESFQNWQSEFLAVAVLVGASVYLREKGSPESKPVAEPHYETGT